MLPHTLWQYAKTVATLVLLYLLTMLPLCEVCESMKDKSRGSKGRLRKLSSLEGLGKLVREWEQHLHVRSLILIFYSTILLSTNLAGECLKTLIFSGLWLLVGRGLWLLVRQLGWTTNGQLLGSFVGFANLVLVGFLAEPLLGTTIESLGRILGYQLSMPFKHLAFFPFSIFLGIKVFVAITVSLCGFLASILFVRRLTWKRRMVKRFAILTWVMTTLGLLIAYRFVGETQTTENLLSLSSHVVWFFMMIPAFKNGAKAN